MSFRGRGRGRGGFVVSHAKQVPFELFPEIEGLGHAEYSTAKLQMIKWSSGLLNYWHSSPYFYEDKSGCSRRTHAPDIERYSDISSQATKTKPPLWHFIKLDVDHVPVELARGEKKGKRAVKRIRWNPELDLQNQDPFEKLFQKHEAEDQEGNAKKENEDEEEEDDEEGNDEDDGEYSDEGDYGQTEYFDDDEDDFNMAEDDNDEPMY